MFIRLHPLQYQRKTGICAQHKILFLPVQINVNKNNFFFQYKSKEFAIYLMMLLLFSIFLTIKIHVIVYYLLHFTSFSFPHFIDPKVYHFLSLSAFLTSLIQGFTTNLWIGLNNLRHSNRFNWQDNSAFFYSNWNAGEPNGNSQSGRGRTVSNVNKLTFLSWNGKTFPDQWQSL